MVTVWCGKEGTGGQTWARQRGLLEEAQRCTWGCCNRQMELLAGSVARSPFNVIQQIVSPLDVVVRMLPLPSAWSPAVQTCCEQPTGSMAAMGLCWPFPGLPLPLACSGTVLVQPGCRMAASLLESSRCHVKLQFGSYQFCSCYFFC